MIGPFKVSIPNVAVALLLSEALLIFSCYVAAAYLALSVPPVVFLFEQGGYWHVSFLTAVIMLGLYFNGLYENYRVRSRIQLIQQFCLVLGVAFLLQSLLGYAQWDLLLPKWVMVYGSVLVLLVLPLWRIFFASLIWKSVGGQKLLFLGSSPAMREIAVRLLERPDLGLAPIGYLGSDQGDEQETSSELPGAPRLGSLAELDEVIADQHPARISIGLNQVTNRPQHLPVERLLELRLAGLQIEEVSVTYEMVFGRVSTRDLPPSFLIFTNAMSPGRRSATLQAAYSPVLALIALAIALPLMAILALIVRFSSPGPVLYRQPCIGLNGALFSLFKFRSDGRSWISSLRLDELPQLFNVLRGEMALVGPRPERPEFVSVLEEQIPYYRQRLSVKPGITGWAQINEKKNAETGIRTIEDTIEKLEYDRYYIKHLSIALDAYIVFHTFRATVGIGPR